MDNQFSEDISHNDTMDHDLPTVSIPEKESEKENAGTFGPKIIGKCHKELSDISNNLNRIVQDASTPSRTNNKIEKQKIVGELIEKNLNSIKDEANKVKIKLDLMNILYEVDMH